MFRKNINLFLNHFTSKWIISNDNYLYIKNFQPKVAIIAPTLDTVPSRFGNAIYDLVEDIAVNSSFPVLIISRYFKDHPISIISDQIIYYDYEREMNLFEKTIGYRGRKVLWGISHVFDKFYLKRVLHFLENTSVKIVMTEDHLSFLPALSSFFSKRFTFLHHQHSNAFLNVKPYFSYRFTKYVNDIIFVSEITMLETKEKVKLAKPILRFIYNGIKLSNYPKPDLLRNNSINLLFVGRIIPGKGVKELITAVLNLNNIHVQLKIVGNFEDNIDHGDEFYIKEIKQLAYASGGRIELCGQVSQEKLSDFYIWSDFVVVPSIFKEGLPKVVFESLIMGKPVITSRRGGISEFIINKVNGVYIEDPVDECSIQKAIEIAFTESSLLQLNTFNAMDDIRRYLCTERMAFEFDQIFKYYIK